MNSTRGKMKGLNSYTDGGMNAGGNAKMRKVGGVLATKTSLISSVRVKNVCRIAESLKRKSDVVIQLVYGLTVRKLRNMITY